MSEHFYLKRKTQPEIYLGFWSNDCFTFHCIEGLIETVEDAKKVTKKGSIFGYCASPKQYKYKDFWEKIMQSKDINRHFKYCLEDARGIEQITKGDIYIIQGFTFAKNIC